MFVRGSSSGEEYRRVDNSFYRGIVVKNNDPEKLNRVKVYIPEISNQPYDEWLESYDTFILKAIGSNVNKGEGDWGDTQIFEEICKYIPWAEPCYPILGESGNFRYVKSEEKSIITDCNYKEGFDKNETTPPDKNSGSFSPAYLFEFEETMIFDPFHDQVKNYTVKTNTYSYGYSSSKHVNNAKGVFGIPEVGAKVWVFHYEGDLNFPVYFGTMQDLRSISPINNTDNTNMISPNTPNNFEN
jgi:hypothetical protein